MHYSRALSELLISLSVVSNLFGGESFLVGVVTKPPKVLRTKHVTGDRTTNQYTFYWVFNVPLRLSYTKGLLSATLGKSQHPRKSYDTSYQPLCCSEGECVGRSQIHYIENRFKETYLPTFFGQCLRCHSRDLVAYTEVCPTFISLQVRKKKGETQRFYTYGECLKPARDQSHPLKYTLPNPVIFTEENNKIYISRYWACTVDNQPIFSSHLYTQKTNQTK